MVEVLPGDSLVTRCNYDSSLRTHTTYYGDSTSDEMCFAFIVYYPAVHGFSECGSYRSLDVCHNVNLESGYIYDCELSTVNDTIQTYLPMLQTSCAKDGLPACQPGCQDTVERMRASNAACLQGDTAHMLESWYQGTDLLRYIHACDEDWDVRSVYGDRPNGHVTGSVKDTANAGKTGDGFCIFGGGQAPTGAQHLHLVSLSVAVLVMLW